MKYLAAIAMTVLAASSNAQAGWCERARDDYKKDEAKYSEKVNRYMKENIDKGCAPGGFYDQLDKAEREAEAQCKAHPDTKGC